LYDINNWNIEKRRKKNERKNFHLCMAPSLFDRSGDVFTNNVFDRMDDRRSDSNWAVRDYVDRGSILHDQPERPTMIVALLIVGLILLILIWMFALLRANDPRE